MAMHQPIGDWMKTTDWRMIKADGFKYVWHHGMADELFDINTDAGEIVNLAEATEYQPRKQSLRRELGAFLAQTNDPLLAAWQSDAGPSSSISGG
jgi:hypothetical protein